MRCRSPFLCAPMLCILLLTGCPRETNTPTPLVEEDDVVLTREHLSATEPGSMMDIHLEIDVARGVDISAIAVVENIPAGWEYRGVSHEEDIIPAIRPLDGTENSLTFVWVQTPKFPYTFSYSLSVPLGAEGTETLAGHAEYRQGNGESEYTDTLVSDIVVN